MATNFVNKIFKAVKGNPQQPVPDLRLKASRLINQEGNFTIDVTVAVFMVKSTVGYLPMMLLRVISRKINERTAIQSAQHQREYAQQVAQRLKNQPGSQGGPGGARPQMVGTHYQPPYYYNEPVYNKDVADIYDKQYDAPSFRPRP